MGLSKNISLLLSILLLAGGSTALAHVPVSQGWGLGFDVSRTLGGHAVMQLERAQSSEWLWKVAVGRHIGTPGDMTPSWKGLKGEVLSGSVVSMGTLVFPQQSQKLGASWFLGMDVTRESYRIQRYGQDAMLLQESSDVVLQSREEARLVVGAQWALGAHLALRAHVGVGAVRDRLSSRSIDEEVNSLPMARPGGVALIWRW